MYEPVTSGRAVRQRQIAFLKECEAEAERVNKAFNLAVSTLTDKMMDAAARLCLEGIGKRP